jgi:quercetin dioxygenase-like cupin family protein
MDHTDFEKSISHQLVDSVEYVSGSVVTRSVLKQNTGTVTLSSFDAGEVQPTQYFPFDHLILILDGEAFLCMNEEFSTLEKGQAIIIPAHVKHWIKANKRFKMLSTVIKSGYEDVSI